MIRTWLLSLQFVPSTTEFLTLKEEEFTYNMLYAKDIIPFFSIFRQMVGRTQMFLYTFYTSILFLNSF